MDRHPEAGHEHRRETLNKACAVLEEQNSALEQGNRI